MMYEMNKLMRLNMHELARTVTIKEGKKRSVSIGQVKEVIRLTMRELANNYSEKEVLRALKRYRY